MGIGYASSVDVLILQQDAIMCLSSSPCHTVTLAQTGEDPLQAGQSSGVLLGRHIRALSARADSSKYSSLLGEECSRKNTPRICLLFSTPSLITIKCQGSLPIEPSSCHPAPCTVKAILSKAAPTFLQKAKSDHISTLLFQPFSDPLSN